MLKSALSEEQAEIEKAIDKFQKLSIIFIEDFDYLQKPQ